jgi:hypothetical protein
MSMAMFAQMKELTARVADLERQYIEVLARLQQFDQKKTLELPKNGSRAA